MIRKSALLLPLLSALLLALACGGNDAGEESVEGDTGDGQLLVTVNGEEIRQSDVDAETARLFRRFEGQVSPMQAEQMRAELNRRALENLINKVVLLDAVTDEGIDVGESKVDSLHRSFKDQFPTEEAYEQGMSQLEMSESELRTGLHEQIGIENLLEPVTSAVAPPTDEEVRSFYEENQERFHQDEAVHARHILLLASEDEDEAGKAERLEKIKEIRQQIVMGGADFASLAMQHSDCPSSEQGGDLGWFGRGRMVGPFEDAAFTLEEGEVSDIVETQFGYHIIKKEEYRPAGMLAFEEVEEQIRQQLLQEKTNEAIQAYIEELREDADIVFAQPEMG